ncbi:RNA-binding protein 42 [Cydia splendana]|uniref:RNA-binding protein 42 n=1 Tax=Cydia splendana TaxID=1100963 RepID=UPI0028F4C9F6
MDDSNKYQQMQDEMSRFEAEISGEHGPLRGVISAGTYGAVQQRLERAIPPPPPPPAMLSFDPNMSNMPNMPGNMPNMPGNMNMMPRMMFPAVPPPPPPPSMPNMMIPASVQRLRPGGMPEFPMHFLRPGMPGPQLAPPPPPRPQPVVLSAAPKLYKQPKDEDKDKEKHETKKRKRSPPAARPLTPPRVPTPPPAPLVPVAVAVTVPVPDTAVPKPKKEKKHRKVVRTAGGQVWEDVTLLDWPDDDFRMFCGDLGNDVTDELLTRTFSKYTSFQRAKVIRDKRTNKSKGFGFVSFKDPGDFIKAMKEMDGRYVGSRPIKLRKSTWKSRALDVVRKKEKEKAALLSLLMAGNKS